jgi:hypothetical protein
VESRVKKILGWTAGGIVSLAVLGAIAIGIIYDIALRDIRKSGLAGLPPAWADSLRNSATPPPELANLAARPAGAGNAAELAWDSTAYEMQSTWRPLGEACDRWALGEATAADSTTLRASVGDTSLQQWAAWADRGEWDILPLMVARTDDPVIAWHTLRTPRYLNLTSWSGALCARGVGRLMRGDRGGARSDFDAVVRLSSLILRHDPTIFGLLVGRRGLLRGARGLAAVGAATRDTSLVRRATEVRDWATYRPRAMSALQADAATAHSLAGDTTLLAGMRSEAMLGMVATRTARVLPLLFGPPASLKSDIAALPAGSTPNFERMRELVLATVEALDREGMRYRFQIVGTF